MTRICDIIRDDYSEVSIEESESNIYRVHMHLRNVNPQAYEPEIVSIGPYHRGKGDLKMMERHKLRYLHLLLDRQKGTSLEMIVSTVAALEPRVRKCYAEPIDHSSSDFVKMLVFDGCFIIELVRKYWEPELRQANDPIFSMDWIIFSLQRDLMLFENQIPFFVLLELWGLIEIPENQLQERLTSQIIYFFGDLYPGKPNIMEVSSQQDIKHLLHLIHTGLPPVSRLDADKKGKGKRWRFFEKNLRGLERLMLCSKKRDADTHGPLGQNRKQKRWRFINSVAGLREANVMFKKNEGPSLFDIQFKNGTMLIPPLKIEDGTEAFFRNLIAYEQYDAKSIPKVTDYVTFLDSLVNSSKDVEILSSLEIVENWLGDDEVVAKMVNKLGDFVNVDSDSRFFYANTFTDVNDHCGKSWNKWMAKLRRNYLHSPWAIISVVAAVVLLLLTVAQTVFSIFQVV